MSFTAPSLGVVVKAFEVPPPSGVPINTATAFVVGRGDQGAVNTFLSANSIVQAASVIGPRSSTNSVLYDSLDIMFQLGVPQAYIGRVAGPSPINATLTLNDSGAHPTLAVTADWPGVNGNGLYIVVAVSGSNFTITLQDVLGNVLAQSPSLANQQAAINWSATAPFITIAAAVGGGATTNNPVALSATPLAGGTDDYTNATLSNWQTSLGLFPFTLGPGQVLAPGQTNTTLNGIWSALDFHGNAFNRFACKDLASASPSAQISAIASINSSSTASWGMFDQPSALIPGVVSGTLRTVPASAIRAGLCAQADTGQGIGGLPANPNQAPAGHDFALNNWVSGFNWFNGVQPIDSDVLLLNQAGINTFENRYKLLESYGDSTPVPQTGNTSDPSAIYWQATASRLRMAAVAIGYEIGEEFAFSQIDGKGVEINAYGTALTDAFKPFYDVGAFYGATANEAYRINVGPSVNTPASINAGELKARLSYRPSRFAEMVELDLYAVPTIQSLP